MLLAYIVSASTVHASTPEIKKQIFGNDFSFSSMFPSPHASSQFVLRSGSTLWILQTEITRTDGAHAPRGYRHFSFGLGREEI